MFGTRKRLDAIERSIGELSAKLEKAAEPRQPNMGDALASLLGKTIDGQANMVGALGDLAIRGAARRMGIRGGTKRASDAERSKTGKFLPRRRREETDCRLCDDPMSRNLTIQEIQTHRTHEASRNGVPHKVEPTESGSTGSSNSEGTT